MTITKGHTLEDTIFEEMLERRYLAADYGITISHLFIAMDVRHEPPPLCSDESKNAENSGKHQ